MLPNPKALLAFAGRFLLIFFLLLPLWFVLTPAYNHLLAAGTNIVIPFTEEPHIHTLVGWQRDILIVRSDTPFVPGMKIQGFTGYLTHFNLILMTALVLAPQRIGWRRRCQMLAIALAVLFLIHVLYLVIGVKFFQQSELEAFQSAAGRLYVWGTNLYLSIAGQLVPVVIWMALYWAFGGTPHDAPIVPEGSASERKGKKRVGGRKGNHAP